MLTNTKRLLGNLFLRTTKNRVAHRLSQWAGIPKGGRPSGSQEGSVDLHHTATGSYYLPNNAPHDCIIKTLVAGKIFEPEVVAVAQEFCKPGTAMLDIGANFGQMSILFSKMVEKEGLVYSFEADPFIFELLKKNLVENRCQNAIPNLGAVLDRCGDSVYYPVQDFVRFAAYGSYGIDPNAKEGRAIPTLTIDSLAIEMPISFAKIDIQGSDLMGLKGAVETIKKHKMPILFEFEQQFQGEFNTSFQDYVDFVQSINYRFERVVDDINYLITPR